jgi:hypothetical protein
LDGAERAELGGEGWVAAVEVYCYMEQFEVSIDLT